MGIRARRRPSADVSPVAWAILRDDEPPADGDPWEAYIHEWHPDEGPPSRVHPSLRQCWEACRDEILPEWIAERPGTRPRAWWRWDYPEAPPLPTGRGVSSFKEAPPADEQVAILRRLGLLTYPEIEALAA